MRTRCLGALFLERAHKAVRVGDGGRLELFEGLQVALALFALQLEERDGGSQGNGVGVFAF